MLTSQTFTSVLQISHRPLLPPIDKVDIDKSILLKASRGRFSYMDYSIIWILLLTIWLDPGLLGFSKLLSYKSTLFNQEN